MKMCLMKDKKIRVLQVNKLYSPWIGGVEKVVQQIAEGLNDSCQMTVLACQPHGSYREDKVNGVKVLRAGSLGMLFSMPISFSFPFLLRKIVKDNDIVHVHMPFPLVDLSSLLIGNKKKIIIWWHSDIVRQKLLKALLRPFMHMLLRRADRILVATPDHIESSEDLREYRKKCEVIHFGIDLKQYELTSEMIKKVDELKLKFPGRNLLFVGRLIYYKGIKYLVDAMKGIDARLLIVGNGPLKNELTDYAIKNGILSKIVFLGKVADSDLLKLYHLCDLFVLPSTEKTEAFGLVQLEAMACGKPIVNTLLGTGVNYVSIDGQTGLTVSPRNSIALSKAINALLDNDRIRLKFGSAAKKRAKELFSIDSMLQKIYNVYEKIYDK